MNMKNAITYKNRNGYLYPLLALPETEKRRSANTGVCILIISRSIGGVHTFLC